MESLRAIFVRILIAISTVIVILASVLLLGAVYLAKGILALRQSRTAGRP